MKEIVIISGKGGTGKTSITAAFAAYNGNNAIVADCDVDAADMHLLLDPTIRSEEDFYSGKLAVINKDICSGCGICMSKCRFDAIDEADGVFSVNNINCEGCGYCAVICPEDAIAMPDNKVGKLYVSQSRFGSTLVHARLEIAAENSGKLVAKVKSEARQQALDQEREFVLVDGSPGIGCPVVSSLTGANYVVFVSEPTYSALNDLKRVYELVRRFGISSGCIINKADLNIQIAEEIKTFLKEENIELLGSFPYDSVFTKAITDGLTIFEIGESGIIDRLVRAWEKIKKLTNHN